MGVSVIGLDYDNVGDGLSGALKKTFAEAAANGNMIINLAEAAKARAAGRMDGPKKDDPRPAYVYQAFPKHMHHPDGRVRTVANPAALKGAAGEGFREEPYPVVRVAVADPAAEKAARIAKDADTEGKIASQNDLIQKLMAQVADLAKK